MHSGFVGMSRSGKTTLAQMTAAALVKRGRAVGVFDPLRDPKWDKTGAELVTADPFELLHHAKTHTRWHLFWEEWGAYIRLSADPEVRRAAPAFAWLGRTSRQLGHSNWIIAHRWQDVEPGLREQLDQCFAFAQGNKSAAMMAEDFGRPELAAQLPKLSRGVCKFVRRMADNVPIGTIDFARRRVRWAKSG